MNAAEQPMNLCILGSTGSIGRQTLEIVELYPERFRVKALAAGTSVEVLAAQVERYRPDYVCINDPSGYAALRERLPGQVQLRQGVPGMEELAALDAVDTVVAAVSGAVGIRPVMAAIRQAKRIALANKETLVAAGEPVMQAVADYQAELIPVDSEHSALFQCLRDEGRFMKKLWITASGGPFRKFSAAQLRTVDVALALQHPNWSMGPKITVDSSTLMNKGLEVIEAHHLFHTSYDRIEVLVQPESAIHSMVEFVDGTFLAQLGSADMRAPIQYALTYPERQPSPVSALDFFALGRIHFERPDVERFPCLALALEAGRAGGTLPAVMNAANEVAVNAFLQRQLAWWQIPLCVEKAMAAHHTQARPALDTILELDQEIRQQARSIVKALGN